MQGMMDGMNWMMWGGLLLWLLVLAVLVWAAVVLVKHLRSNRAK
jgi:hypothetical protein